MKIFGEREVDYAIAYADEGGQALHLHRFIVGKAPACFRRDVARGIDIGHLFDQDRHRLEDTARRLGVRVVVIDRPGTRYQHVDLCGMPMQRALKEALQVPEAAATPTQEELPL